MLKKFPLFFLGKTNFSKHLETFYQKSLNTFYEAKIKTIFLLIDIDFNTFK